MIPSPIDIKYFLAVAEKLNLSRAAESLGVVQPTLTQSLKRLEYTLGKDLFVRQKNGVVLTRAGELFRINCQNILSDWNRLVQSMNDLDETPSGQYSIGCHPSVGLYGLKYFVRDILASPEITLNFEHGLSREITEAVVSRKIDFGLVINPVRHNDLVLKKLCNDRFGLWKSLEAPSDTLIYDGNLNQAQVLIKKIKSSAAFKRHITSNNLEIIADLASASCGVALLPERVARRFKNLMPYSDHWLKDELFLIHHVGQSKTAGFKLIKDTIIKNSQNI